MPPISGRYLRHYTTSQYVKDNKIKNYKKLILLRQQLLTVRKSILNTKIQLKNIAIQDIKFEQLVLCFKYKEMESLNALRHSHYLQKSIRETML